MFQKKVT